MVWIVTFLRVLVVVEPIGEWELYCAMHDLIGDGGMAKLLKCSAGRLRQLTAFRVRAILNWIDFNRF